VAYWGHLLVLGLDSAPNTTGWAIVERDGPREKVVMFGRIGRVAGPVMRAFLLGKQDVTLVAIEEPYLGLNPKTHAMLCRWAGRWEMACELAGLRHRLVRASIWQQGILAGLIHRRSPRVACKLAAQRWVELTFGLITSEDEADAIAMATWQIRQLALKQRILAG
jgi:Holliday junction resolvasome RuvABC endonuclease subunit